MKKLMLLVPAVLALAACAPHPGAGIWTAADRNAWGISRLTLAYEGRAMFDSSTPPTNWHCFWGGRDKHTARLDCTPSSDTGKETQFLFSVNQDGIGTLSLNGKPLGHFRRMDGKPEIP